MRKVAVILFALLTMLSGSFAMAQTPVPSASPEASPAAGAPGSIQIILEADAGPGKASGDRALLTTYRITMPPNGEMGSHEHVGNVVWRIEKGEITFTAEDGDVWGECADGCEGSTIPAGESGLLPTNQPVTFEKGDTIVWHDTVTHSWTNTGQGAAIIFATTIYDEGDVTTQACGGGCM